MNKAENDPLGRVIYKYPVELFGWTEVPCPPNSRVLHVGVQNNLPFMWLERTRLADASTTIGTYVVTTGGTVPPFCEYAGTFTLDDGGSPFVGHVYWNVISADTH